MTHTFQTTVILEDDTAVEVTVAYGYTKGYAGDHTDPPESDMVEIQLVTPDVPASAYDDLAAEAFEDYAAYQADAAEYRYAASREDW